MGKWLGEHGESYACQLGYPASPTFCQACLGLDFLSSIVLFPCRNVVDLSQACVVCQEELVCRGSFPVLYRMSCLCQTQAPDSPMLSFLSLSFNKSASPVSVTHRKSKSFYSCLFSMINRLYLCRLYLVTCPLFPLLRHFFSPFYICLRLCFYMRTNVDSIKRTFQV